MIKVVNLEVHKGGRSIVRNINLELHPGKVSVLVGKNGAGKSTILEALTGKNSVAKPNILWDGYPLGQLSSVELAQRRAVLSQSVTIPFALQVRQLVEMGTYVSEASIPTIKIDSLVMDALRAVGLPNMAERNFQSLSGGEQKRVLLAKCLVQLNCCRWADVQKYLFLDEPTAGLDLQQQFNLIELVKNLVRRRQIGVLAIVHDLNLAAQLADEVILLQAGEVVATGPPEVVLRPILLEQVFGVKAVVSAHPVLDCPHITLLPTNPQRVKHPISSTYQ